MITHQKKGVFTNKDGAVVRPASRRAGFWLGALALTLAGASRAHAQTPFTLTGTSYTQTFDSVGTALPAGFGVYTGATATSVGTAVTFVTTATAYSSSTGQFANYASADSGVASGASTATQAADTDRVIGLRQTAAFGNPGAAIDFNINASNATFSGSGTALAFSLQTLSVQTSVTSFSIQYGIGSSPTTFTTLGTYSDAGAFGSTPFTYTGDQLAALSGQANVVFRVVALTASTGSGSRPTIGLDDLSLAYMASAAPTNNIYFDLNGTTAGSGVTTGGSYTFSGSHFNPVADGTGTTGAFTSGQTATFSAGTDANAATYTVNIDTAVSTNGIAVTGGNLTLAHATGGSLTLTGASINVATGSGATISEVVGGTVGLTKDGAGTLTLSGTNNGTGGYSGSTTIDAGILSVSSAANLPASTNGITLAGGTLQTTASLSAGNAFTGTGLLDIALGTTLTSSGVFSTTAVTLANTGTLSITNATAGQAIGNVTFNATSTIANTGSALAVGNVTVGSGSTGVATISGPISLASGAHTFAVPDTNTSGVDLAINGIISGTGGITKSTGAGTLALNGNNSFSGTITFGGTTVTGGTISLGNANALGTGTLNFNDGTVSNDTGVALSTARVLSIGAAGGTGITGGATFAGSDITVTGGVSFYAPAAATQIITVNNHTTFTGVVATGSAASTGVLVNGSGTLTLTGSNTFSQPVTVSGATLEAASTTGGTGGALYANTKLTVNSSGTVLFSTANQSPATPITLSTGALSFATGANQGSGKTLSGGAVTTGTNGATGSFGALTLAANSTLNYLGTSGTVVFASFDPTNSGAGTYTLNVTGSNFGTTTDSADGSNDRLIFDQDISAAGYLGDITFNGVGGAKETSLTGGYYEITPAAVPEPATVFAGLLLSVAAGWSQRRRVRSWLGVRA